ncbi:MAG: hypothetical protein LBN12_04970 [Clostridiales Family XIII bacterium]|jgi:hypothetical protein|nr:hypothetical protein [Clostridiales Family XIII bacterium]
MEEIMQQGPRIPYLKPEDMTGEQKAFYDDILENMGNPNAPHIWRLDEGQINGPFTSMLHYPETGYLLYKLQLKIVKQTLIPKDVIETFILTVVAKEGAAYGIYAHELLAQQSGVSPGIVKAIKENRIPEGLQEPFLTVYALAAALCRPGPPSQEIYESAVGKFGVCGYNMLVNTAAMFKYLGTLMNAYDEPIPVGENPEGDEKHGDPAASVFQTGM